MLKQYFTKDNLVTVVLVIVGTVAANLFVTTWISNAIAKAKAKAA
jgi:hypothetical protein